MLNKAMQVMETLRNAEENRATLVNEHLDALNVLGYESTPIVINKGHIVEVQTINDELVEKLQMQLDEAKEELDYYHDVEKDYNNDIELFQKDIARHLRRINELAADNERLIDESIALENEISFKDGQILGLNSQIKQLEDKVSELQTALNAKKLTKKETVKGDDAMEQPETTQKKKTSKLDMMKKLPKTKEFSFKDANEEIKTQTKEEVKEETTITINWTQDIFDEKVNSFSCMMMGVHGDITIDKTYNFKARREYYMPVIYGCFDERVAEQAREEINKIDRFRLSPERTTNDTSFKYAQDKDYPIVVWRLSDDKGTVYRAYAKTKGNCVLALTWDKNLDGNQILSVSVKSLFSNKPAWRKINSKVLADKFMAVCADIWPEDFTNDNNDSQITKEQHQSTKEVSQDTNEIVIDFTNNKNATDVTNEDPTAGCDDLDI